MSTKFPLFAFVALAMLLGLSACTRVVVVDTPMEALPTATIASAEGGEDWWDVDFTMSWDPGESPDTFLDALIADQICAPALASAGSRIRLWRFHRRHVRDAIGHRFRMRVYTDAEGADKLYEHIRASSVLEWLETDEWVESVSMDRRERPEEPAIARASDANWPQAIQESWPWFIMGVSQAWLVLVKEVSAERAYEGNSKWSLLDHYQNVNETINDQWRVFGQHAYLHHLNAIFAYKPLVIRGNYLMSF